MTATDHRANVTAAAVQIGERTRTAYSEAERGEAAAQLAGLTRGMRGVMHTLTNDRQLWQSLIATGTLSGYALGIAQGHVEATTAAVNRVREQLATVTLP